MVPVGRWRSGLGPGVVAAPGAGACAGRRLLVALAAFVALAGACGGSGGGSGASGATVPKDTSPTSASSAPSTTAAIDITSKPPVVTVAYADAVMDELDRLLSDAIREFVANDGPTKKFDDLLNAVYDEPSLENARSDYGSLATDGVDEFRHPPGDVETTVERLLKSTDDCVVMQVDRTFAEALAAPPKSKGPTYIALRPKGTNSDPSVLNGTAWTVVFDGGVLPGEDPTKAC
jgi:hypothetical protein